MLDETFAESFVVPRATLLQRSLGYSAHRVLGLSLRPFSFWHAFLLEAIESPFAGCAAPLNFAALVNAVMICRCRYPHRPASAPSIRELFFVQRHRSRYLQELSRFSQYLACGSAGPVHAERDDAPPVKSPWQLVTAAWLLRYGYARTLAEAWNFPVNQANWLNTAAAEARGNKIDILTPQDRAQLNSLGIEV